MSNRILHGKIRKIFKYFYQENTVSEPGYYVHIRSSTFVYKIIGYEVNVFTYVISKKHENISLLPSLFLRHINQDFKSSYIRTHSDHIQA